MTTVLDAITPNVPGLDTGLRAGQVTTVRTPTFLATATTGAVIANLVDPFGGGATYSTVGTVPPQLALSGGRIVKGSGVAVADTDYRIRLMATSSDGLRETSTILTFKALSQVVAQPAPSPTPAPTPTLLSADIFYMGDSRIASFYNDTSTKNNKNAGNHLVVANTQMGQRMVTIGNTAVAGQRSDEFNSSTATMTASTAGTLIGLGVVNDIAQGRTGAESWGTVKAIIDAAMGANKAVIWHTEPGAEAFSATQIGYRNAFNSSLLAYAAANPTKLRVFDFAAAVLVDPTSTTSIAFKAGYSYDGTHLTNAGARGAGAAFAAWAATQIGGTAAVLLTLQTGNLVTNKQFATATGGSVQAALTGTAPAGWSIVRTGTGAGAVSVSASPDGNGNELVIAATAGAASDRVQASQQITTGFALNDKARFLVEVAVDAGATNLRSVRAYISGWYNGLAISAQKFDMQPIPVHLNAAGTANVDLLSPEVMTLFAAGATSLDRIDITVAAEFSGAGSATFRIRQPTLLKV